MRRDECLPSHISSASRGGRYPRVPRTESPPAPSTYARICTYCLLAPYLNDDATNDRRRNPPRIFSNCLPLRLQTLDPAPSSSSSSSCLGGRRPKGKMAGGRACTMEVPQLACDNDLRHVLCVCWGNKKPK